jgi:predicted PurR-regulated permease PerM
MNARNEVCMAQLPRTVTVFAVLSGIVITVLGLRELGWLVTPALFAFVIVILVHPLYTGLVRRGIPGPAALIVLLVAVFGMILALITVVIYALGRLATILPAYVTSVTEWTQEVAEYFGVVGIGSQPVRELFESVDLLSVARWLTTQIPSVVTLAASLLLIYSLLLFVSVESTQVRYRSAALFEDHPRLGTSLLAFVENTRRYVAVTGAFAIIVGALDTVFLLILGIPLAFLWGLLAAVCNFIPYVGFIVGLAPPALLALLDQGWQSMLLVIIVYIVLNSIITTLLPAKFVGDAVGMSMTVTIASVAFWSWVLGPLGAILAIPSSLLVKAIFIDSVPSARWLAGFVDAAPRAGPTPAAKTRRSLRRSKR